MRVRLEYGRTGLDVELPEGRSYRTLAYKQAEPLADPTGALRELLTSPRGTPPLTKIAEGCQTAVIAICDITRPVPNELILTPMLETLEQSGIDRKNITLLIATGMHRPSTLTERIELVGQKIADNYKVVDHNGHAQEQHTYLGDSPRGVPIWIDTSYVEADLKITVGLIEPHFMAGFSGGRKLVCPGLAGVDTVKVWHGPAFMEHPKATTGILEGNPVHEENTWIARHVGCNFIVNVVIDEQRRPLKFVAGDMEEAFLEGVAFVRDIVTDTVPKPVDIVVTSSAGYPLDTTFYQAVKGMSAVLPIIKEGGTIILAASLSEGIGSKEFTQLFKEHADAEAFMQCILGDDYFVLDQWQVEKLAHVIQKANVIVVSDGLPPETIRGLYVDSASSVEAALEKALAQHGPDATVALIPKGPYVMAQVA